MLATRTAARHTRRALLPTYYGFAQTFYPVSRQTMSTLFQAIKEDHEEVGYRIYAQSEEKPDCMHDMLDV